MLIPTSIAGAGGPEESIKAGGEVGNIALQSGELCNPTSGWRASCRCTHACLSKLGQGTVGRAGQYALLHVPFGLQSLPALYRRRCPPAGVTAPNCCTDMHSSEEPQGNPAESRTDRAERQAETQFEQLVSALCLAWWWDTANRMIRGSVGGQEQRRLEARCMELVSCVIAGVVDCCLNW